jgi:hypothetical protein
MQELKEIGISDSFEGPIKEISLSAAPQSSGAKWGHTKEILVCVPPNLDLKKMSLVSIRRDQHPEIKDGEFLLSDFVGMKVQNSAGKSVGKILGCEDHLSEALHQNINEGVNLVIGTNASSSFSVPLAWIDKTKLQDAPKSGFLVIDDVETWMNLDALEKSDEEEE